MAYGPYARLYGRISSLRKFRRAPFEAIGVWTMCLAYCIAEETDGRVDNDWLEELIPRQRERARLLKAACEAGLIDQRDANYHVHDFRDHNMSGAEWREKLRKKQDAGRKGGSARKEANA